MSPKINTKLPPKVDGHYSEYQLGKTLEKLEDEKLELLVQRQLHSPCW